jgi:imidazolonepropionase-like amidohydrolase
LQFNGLTRVQLIAFCAFAMGCAPVSAVFQADDSSLERRSHGDSTAIKLGKLVNPADGTILEDAIVVIEEDRFTYVGTNEHKIPCGATIIDWSEYTGLPGLVDAHTHLLYQTDNEPGFTPWQRSSWLGVNDLATVEVLGRAAASAALSVGVTTLIDKGTGSRKTPLLLQLRDEFAAGTSVGPRMYVAGPGIAAGPTTTAADIVAAVQAQAALGIDLVKIWADSCSANNLVCNPTFTQDMLQAGVDEAHALDLPIAIHAYHLSTAELAIAAGPDSLEHAEGLADSHFADMIANDVTYVPTIDHNRYYIDNLAFFGYPPETQAELEAFIELNLQTASFAHAAGVPMATGSDAVFTGFGENTRELAWLVEAGMTPMDALRAATVGGAASIGVDDEVGQVEVGYYADIIAVEGDPLEDIEDVIYNVRGVVKGGKLVE